MDPATMLLLGSIASAGASALTSNKGERGSTYSKAGQKTIDDILKDLKGMKGTGQDITRQPGYQTGQDWLMSMFNDPEFFKSFEAPLMRQFNEEIVPGLANRFAAQGSGGALGSTAFRNQLAREGSNLSTNIAALRGGMQQQAIPQLLQYAQQPVSNYQNLLNSILRPTENTYQPPSSGPFGGLTSALSSGAIQAYVNQYANPGAAPSTQAGYQAQYPMTNQYATQFQTGELY